HVRVAEEGVEADVAARFVRQQIGLAVGAGRAAWRAMDGDAEEIRLRLRRVAGRLLRLRRAGAEHGRDVDADVLELHVRDREGADVAAGAREDGPGRRRGPAVL